MLNKRIIEIIKELSEEQKNIEKEFNKLRLNLITISAGMISITTALNKNSEIPFFTKIGLILLGLSIIYGFLSIYTELMSKRLSSLETTKGQIELEKKLKINSEKENQLIEDIINMNLSSTRKEVDFLNKLVNILTKKNNPLKYQLFLFLIGILSLILGVIFKFNLKICNFITL